MRAALSIPELIIPPVSTPDMTMDQYAKICGVTKDVVRGWISKGYLPTIRRGKYTLINTMKLAQQNLQEE